MEQRGLTEETAVKLYLPPEPEVVSFETMQSFEQIMAEAPHAPEKGKELSLSTGVISAVKRVGFLVSECFPAACLPGASRHKHHDMTTRSFTTRADLRKAIKDGFDMHRRLQAKGDNELRLAAVAHRTESVADRRKSNQ